ncbi:MAG: hypothetical protein WAK04_05295 [Xanthobacteraceae bacterium]
MPTWKRLTTTSGTPVAVSTSAIAYILASKTHSTLHFTFTGADGKPHSVIVRESIDIIAGDKSA